MHQELLELVFLHFKVLNWLLSSLFLLVVTKRRFTDDALGALLNFFHFDVLLAFLHCLFILDLVLVQIPLTGLRSRYALIFGSIVDVILILLFFVFEELLHLSELLSDSLLCASQVLTDNR